jgi:phosphatidylglycerophosphate synthase
LRVLNAICDTDGHARIFIVSSFLIVAEEPSPRFLGMPAAERNRRVALRGGGTGPVDAAPGLSSLTVPSQAAITTALFPVLRTLTAREVCLLEWHPTYPPLVWRGRDAAGDAPPGVRLIEDSAVLDVSTAAARRSSAWRLLAASGKPHDGWLSRHVHRKVSRLFSYTFMQLGLSANVATGLTFVIGLLAAAMMAQTSHATMIAGGLLFWFASIADGIDGEVARLTLSESRFGEQLDTGVDQLTHLSGLIGVFIGWWRQGIGPSGLALALAVGLGTPAMLLWAMAMVRRARQTTQFFVPTKPIEQAVFNAADEHRAWPLRAAAAVFVLFRREAFSFSFFLLSLATGRRAAIPAAIAAGLVVVAFTLGCYRSALVRSLRETFDPRPVEPATVLGAPGSSVPA